MPMKRTPMEPAIIYAVGSHILSAQLAAHRDPSAIDQGYLDTLADVSVRAAVALTDAIPRAQKRMDDEDKAAAEAEEMEKAEAEDRKRVADAAAAKAASARAAAATAASGVAQPPPQNAEAPKP